MGGRYHPFRMHSRHVGHDNEKPRRMIHRAGHCRTPGAECADLTCPAWFSLPPDVPDDPSLCPTCRGRMVQRVARSTGEVFYGCARFPKCRGTRPYVAA